MPAGLPSFGPWLVNGVIAQLVERLHGMQEVGGSIPPGSTNPFTPLFFRTDCNQFPDLGIVVAADISRQTVGKFCGDRA